MLTTPSENRNYCLVHLPTTANWAAFWKETTTSHLNKSSVPCTLGRQSVVLTVRHFSWTFVIACLASGDSCFGTNTYATFNAFLTFVTRTSCLFNLFNNPEHNVTGWCNTNSKLCMILPIHIDTRTTRRLKGFDNKLFLIRRTQPYLVIGFSNESDSWRISQMCRTIRGCYVHLFSIKNNLCKFYKCQVREAPLYCYWLQEIINYLEWTPVA